MRCLGIPNTAHFANVTLIEDAVARKYSLVTILTRAEDAPSGDASIAEFQWNFDTPTQGNHS